MRINKVILVGTTNRTKITNKNFFEERRKYLAKIKIIFKFN